MSNTKYKLILIEWVDSKGITSGWEYIEDIEPLKPDYCRSIGFLIEDNEEYKTIAQTIGTTQLMARMTIPACSIKKMKVITSSSWACP